MHERPSFVTRLATPNDLAAVSGLMDLAIRKLQAPFLSKIQIESSFDIMGLDGQLVEDGTYFLVEECGTPIGCGGWSRRATLYGGSHSANRDASLLDPRKDAARIRAMYTHPDHARRGVGRMILRTCEDAARSEGFGRAELVATLSGEPLYRACGYVLMEESMAETRSGPSIPVRLMGKDLT